MSKKALVKSFSSQPAGLYCLNCDQMLVSQVYLVHRHGWPCICKRCGLEHDFHVGKEETEEHVLTAIFDPKNPPLSKGAFQHLWIEWVALTLSIGGILLNANKHILCWPIWALSCIAWILYFALDKKHGGKPQPAAIIMNVVFLLSNIYGWVQWSN